MTIEELIKTHSREEKINVTYYELNNIYWKYKGVLKEKERLTDFWIATNNSIRRSYEKLDQSDRDLKSAYSLIKQDLKIAKKIQKSFLPYINDDFKENYDIAVYHKQLNEVGGDYYDFYKVNKNCYSLGLFDISGHGVSAALVMSYLKAQFMNANELFPTAKQIVNYVNSISFKFLKDIKKYATINYMQFCENSIKYVCGGGYGYIINPNNISKFKKNNNFLGLRYSDFTEHEIAFNENDILACYTDGIIEAKNSENVNYSIERLNSLICDNSKKHVSDILDICIDDYLKFRKKDYDDLTLILIKKKGSR